MTTWQNGQQYLRVTRATREDYLTTPPQLTFEDIGTISHGCGDLDNIHMLQLGWTAPGSQAPRLLAAFRNHNHRGSHPDQIFRITVCRSDDAGRGWVYHSEVACTRPPAGVWEPFLFQAGDDTLQVYYARENADSSQHVIMQRSVDHGLHWQAPIIVAPGALWSRDGMPGVTRYHDGRHDAIFAVFESNERGEFCIMGAKSRDHGQTWTHRAPVYLPRTKRNAGAPQVACVDGRLVVVFMSDESAPHSSWPKHACIRAVVGQPTAPDRIRWSQPCDVSHVNSFWPGALTGNDGCVLVTYNHLVTAVPVQDLIDAA